MTPDDAKLVEQARYHAKVLEGMAGCGGHSLVVGALLDASLAFDALADAVERLDELAERLDRRWTEALAKQTAAEADRDRFAAALREIAEWHGFTADCCDCMPDVVDIARAALAGTAAPEADRG